MIDKNIQSKNSDFVSMPANVIKKFSCQGLQSGKLQFILMRVQSWGSLNRQTNVIS